MGLFPESPLSFLYMMEPEFGPMPRRPSYPTASMLVEKVDVLETRTVDRMRLNRRVEGEETNGMPGLGQCNRRTETRQYGHYLCE